MHEEIKLNSESDQDLPWTGERLIPDKAGDHREVEHRVRYAFAKRYVRGKQVLEVGCGEGYGSNYLASYASKVDAIDISQEAIDHATRKYQRPELVFTRASADSLPFDDEVFDVVVSFEVIEHLPDQDTYLREISRVLRRNGTFFVSTPNKHFYGVNGSGNPFHTREFTPQEFESMLSDHFASIKLYAQIDWWDVKPMVGKEPTRIQKLRLISRAPWFFIKRALSHLIPTITTELAGKVYPVARATNFLLEGKFDFAAYYVASCRKKF